MVGDEKQSRDLIERLTGEDPEKLWQSNIFGKSVYDMIQEGLTAKLVQLPEEVRVPGHLNQNCQRGRHGTDLPDPVECCVILSEAARRLRSRRIFLRPLPGKVNRVRRFFDSLRSLRMTGPERQCKK